MLFIPINPIPSQKLTTSLEGKTVSIYLYLLANGLFSNIDIDGINIMSGVMVLNKAPLISRTYMGLNGNLMIVDSLGSDNPFFGLLGSRFILVYLMKEEIDHALI